MLKGQDWRRDIPARVSSQRGVLPGPDLSHRSVCLCLKIQVDFCVFIACVLVVFHVFLIVCVWMCGRPLYTVCPDAVEMCWDGRIVCES